MWTESLRGRQTRGREKEDGWERDMEGGGTQRSRRWGERWKKLGEKTERRRIKRGKAVRQEEKRKGERMTGKGQGREEKEV